MRAGFRNLAISITILTALSVAQTKPASPPANAALEPILHYISNGWDTLTRSMNNCDSVADPKLRTKPVLYLPAAFPVPASVARMEANCGVTVKTLPQKITAPGQIDVSKIDPPGLLYLEDPYVVPGGRFNEMYGWDSYFIVVGLLRANRIDLARGMVNNFLFEIENYGTVLNANRTYYLTRSQPPFLTSMVLDVYQADKAAGKPDKTWLERAYTLADKDYQMWVREPHLAGTTGLSRYYDFGNGPTPESLSDESGYYRKVAAYFLLHPAVSDHYLVESKDGKNPPDAPGLTYIMQMCDAATTMAHPECEAIKTVRLSADYYKADRSMRESGFDPSFRFEPYSAATHHYAPVCLNSLLYKTESDLAHIAEILGRPADARKWRERAARRAATMRKLMWDAQRGLFFDYNFETGTRSTYVFATTFYPLWTGLATKQEAQAELARLGQLERPGGIAMSTQDTGVQWDLPYGWAPIQLLAIKGMRRYGFNAAADRLSLAFLSTVLENFQRDGTIREKYNVVTRSSETKVRAGYTANVVGFGWTNAAFLELLHDLPAQEAAKLGTATGK
jgi:alpha,alpha-trehalase